MRGAAIKLSWTIDCHLERKTRISRQCFPIIIILNKTFKISWLPHSPFLAQYFLSRFTFIIDIFIENIFRIYEIYLIFLSRFKMQKNIILILCKIITNHHISHISYIRTFNALKQSWYAFFFNLKSCSENRSIKFSMNYESKSRILSLKYIHNMNIFNS